MTPTVHLVLPWRECACPDNAAYRAVPHRGVLLSKRGRAAKAAIHAYALAATRGRLLTGRLALDAIAFPPDARQRDAGNLRKLLTDALQGAVYADDVQLVDERWRMGDVDRVLPRIQVTVTPVLANPPSPVTLAAALVAVDKFAHALREVVWCHDCPECSTMADGVLADQAAIVRLSSTARPEPA